MDASQGNRALRIAIIFNERDTFVEFKPDTFRELLATYLKENEYNVYTAMDKIEQDLRKQTLYK